MDFEKSIEYDLHNSQYCKVIFERYHLEQQIYRSSQSYIYTIKDKFTEQLFTLKAVRKHANIEFALKDIKSIVHSNITPIVNHGSSESFLYIVKPYEDGITLTDYIKANGVLKSDDLIHLSKGLLNIFEYLHGQEKPIIYRDLKPDNIICKPEGQYTLIDILTCRTVKKNQTSDTFYVGTVGYASPEQYGYGQSDVRSDIYTIGSTLFYAVTGETPKIRNLTYVKQKLNKYDCSRKMKYAILKCLQFDPNERFQSITELKNALERFSLKDLLNTKPQNTRSQIPENHVKGESFHDVNITDLRVITDISVTRTGEYLNFFIKDPQVNYLTATLNYGIVTDQVLKKTIYDLKRETLVKYDQHSGYERYIEDKNSNYLVLAYDRSYKCIGYQRILASKLADAGILEFDNKYIRDIPLDHGIIVSTFRDELYLHIDKAIMKDQLKHFKYVSIKSYTYSVTDDDVIELENIIRENPYVLRPHVEDGNRSGPTPGKTCKETDWLFALIDENHKIIESYKLHYIGKK